jgi:4-amino-4-deoxy-L-arabinose transferase-like glycosyltransferase
MIVLIAAILRIYKLGMWSFWVEEFHTVRHTAAIDSIESILGSLRAIYYILNKPVFLLLGETEWTARALPVVFGVLAIPLTYWITRRLFGFTIAILAAFLLAISPWHLYWSQNARFYTLFLLLFNISFVMFYLGIENNRFVYIAVSILTFILATMTHLMAGLLIPVFIIYFILLKIGPFEKPPGLKLLNLLPFIILPILGYVAIEIFRIVIINTIPLYENVYENFISDSRIFPGYEDPVVMLKSVVYYVGIPLTLSSLLGSVFLLYQRNRAGLFMSCGAFFPLFILMVISPIVTVVNRYVFMTLPFWIILAAFGIHALYRFRNPLLWILYLLSLLFLLFRDPVSKDLIYYLKSGQYLPLYIMIVAVLIAIVILWQLLRINSDVDHKQHLILISIVLLILFIHPMITNTLYFEYQHGHRDNLKAATTLIALNKNEGDRVVAAIPLLVEYYLDGETEYVQDFDANVEPQNNQRIWLIEDFGVDQIKDNSFGYWINQNCKMEGKWDSFTGGRNWKMRVYLCES